MEILQQFANGKERTEYAKSTLNSEKLSNIIDGKCKEVVNEIVYKAHPERSANSRASMDFGNYSVDEIKSIESRDGNIVARSYDEKAF